MDFANPHFAFPAGLWVALAAPLLFALLQVHARRARRRDLARLAAPAVLAGMLRAHSPARRNLKDWLLAGLLFCIGFALARPQWGERVEQSESLGEDVVFLLDCSLSMLATDVHPSRLARAKLAIQEFVQHSSRGRAGLVAFAGQAFLQCPLTFDYDAFRDALQAVDERTIPVPGTDLGRALNEGFLAVEKNGRRKILVLVSDGEDLEKTGLGQARILAAKNVVIFAVGLGTPSGSEVYVTGSAGSRELLRNAQGQPVHTRLDETALRAIAGTAHGSYQPLGAQGDGLDHVRRALENADGWGRFVATRREGVDRFHGPVALALAWLIGESLLGTRRPERRRKERGRQPALAARAALLVAGGLAWTAHGTGHQPELPPSPRACYNLGTQQLRAGHWREAERALEAAITSNDPAVQPLALYNAGQARFCAGQEALKGTPLSGVLEPRSEQGIQSADSAIKSADAALAGGGLEAAGAACRQAGAAARNLKQIREALQGSADTCGAVRQRWQRAVDDFQSALELRADYDHARANAGTVDLHLVDLAREQWRIREIQEAVTARQAELKKRLDALKRRLPPEATKGEQGENSDSKDPSQTPKPGDQDTKGENGQEMVLTPAEAMRLLSSLHLDLSRQYSAGNLPDDRQNRAGRNW